MVLPDDLLEVCWENGDGWNELATFLGCELPTSPFPHANDSRRILGTLKSYVRRGMSRHSANS